MAHIYAHAGLHVPTLLSPAASLAQRAQQREYSSLLWPQTAEWMRDIKFVHFDVVADANLRCPGPIVSDTSATPTTTATTVTTTTTTMPTLRAGDPTDGLRHRLHDPAAIADASPWAFATAVELHTVDDLCVLVLASNGSCLVYEPRTLRLLNLIKLDNSSIKSLFYNQQTRHLVTVSVAHDQAQSELHCMYFSIDDLAHGRSCSGTRLFESECLTWPGFVEFDEVNKKVLTYTAHTKLYKVWSAADYRFLYELPGHVVSEAKISLGILVLVSQIHQGNDVVAHVYDIESGELLRRLKHRLPSSAPLELIEQFSENLLIKQPDHNLQVVDITSYSVVDLAHSFLVPNSWIYLHQLHVFLTIAENRLYMWNFQGDLMADFEDHELFRTHRSIVSVSRRHDVIVSHCATSVASLSSSASGSGEHVGGIHISDTRTGRLLFKITELGRDARATASSSSSSSSQSSSQSSLWPRSSLSFDRSTLPDDDPQAGFRPSWCRAPSELIVATTPSSRRRKQRARHVMPTSSQARAPLYPAGSSSSSSVASARSSVSPPPPPPSTSRPRSTLVASHRPMWPSTSGGGTSAHDTVPAVASTASASSIAPTATSAASPTPTALSSFITPIRRTGELAAPPAPSAPLVSAQSSFSSSSASSSASSDRPVSWPSPSPRPLSAHAGALSSLPRRTWTNRRRSALTALTHVVYHDQRQEIYVVTEDGMLFVWAHH